MSVAVLVMRMAHAHACVSGIYGVCGHVKSDLYTHKHTHADASAYFNGKLSILNAVLRKINCCLGRATIFVLPLVVNLS